VYARLFQGSGEAADGMLDIGFSEILVIFVLALIVLGPEKLPRVAAQVGKMIGRARAMARQFREQLEEEVNVEAARKAQSTAPPAIQPIPLPPPAAEANAAVESSAAPGGDAHSGTVQNSLTPEEHSVTAANDTGHADLSNEAWPYAAPVPPPEVADIFGDMLAPPVQPTPQGHVAPPVAAQAEVTPSAPAASPTTQVQWPHDHDIPTPSAETKSATPPGGVASDTHEQGS